jgi:hypothetical protein
MQVLKNQTYITDWQQLGERFHIVADNNSSADDFMAKTSMFSDNRKIAASVEDVFVEKIK